MPPMRPLSLKFAVLRHTDGPDPDHFDLLVEREPGKGDLATWRLSAWPTSPGADATQLRDHRRAFLVYEGELTLSRGRVVRVHDGEVHAELGHDLVVIRFPDGATLHLRRLEEKRWFVHSVL
jgi:hypothetical protein